MTSRRKLIARFAVRPFQFASKQYAEAFEECPDVATGNLRARAVAAVRGSGREWWDEPVCSIVAGTRSPPPTGKVSPTVDAFGVENGATVLSSFEEVRELCCRALLSSSSSSESSSSDDRAREATRRVEAVLFDPEGPHAPVLVANQARDFHKQDGVTEIEECVQASRVERLLNDGLVAAERAGVLKVDRTPAVVCAVQNFSHFLDLSRKVLRNVEVGVPVVVMARGACGQHVYRWARALCEVVRTEVQDAEVRDRVLSLLYFANCDLAAQRRLLSDVLEDSPVYLTGSRDAAVAVRELSRRLFASTGGPNTMVLCADAALDVGPFAAATKASALIENSGQCTALRHVVAPGAHALTAHDLERRLLGPPKDCSDETASPAMSGTDALETARFDALLAEAPGFSALRASSSAAASLADEMRSTGYAIVGDDSDHTSLAAREARDRVAWRVHERSAPDPEWRPREYWRQVVLDVTSPPSRAALMDDAAIAKLAAWTLETQPISVVVNKDAVGDAEGLAFARRLWERTSQCVFSVGDVAAPALTAQARPQDGEIFGEVPPRSQLDVHTAAVVCVPSSTPSFASSYETSYLESLDADATIWATALPPAARAIAAACDDSKTRGYCLELGRYLGEAATGPRPGIGARQTLWGLQRPPLGGHTWLRVSAHDSFDAAAPAIVAFAATNAASQLRISVHPSNRPVVAKLKAAFGDALLDDVFAQRRTDAQFANDVLAAKPWNVLRTSDYDCGARGLATKAPDDYSLASHFVARLFPIGHVKTTRPEDPDFLSVFADSPKWLKAIHHHHHHSP